MATQDEIQKRSTFENIVALKNILDTYLFARRDLIDALVTIREYPSETIPKRFMEDTLSDEVRDEISILFEQYGKEVFDTSNSDNELELKT